MYPHHAATPPAHTTPPTTPRNFFFSPNNHTPAAHQQGFRSSLRGHQHGARRLQAAAHPQRTSRHHTTTNVLAVPQPVGASPAATHCRAGCSSTAKPSGLPTATRAQVQSPLARRHRSEQPPSVSKHHRSICPHGAPLQAAAPPPAPAPQLCRASWASLMPASATRRREHPLRLHARRGAQRGRTRLPRAFAPRFPSGRLETGRQRALAVWRVRPRNRRRPAHPPLQRPPRVMCRLPAQRPARPPRPRARRRPRPRDGGPRPPSRQRHRRRARAALADGATTAAPPASPRCSLPRRRYAALPRPVNLLFKAGRCERGPEPVQLGTARFPPPRSARIPVRPAPEPPRGCRRRAAAVPGAGDADAGGRCRRRFSAPPRRPNVELGFWLPERSVYVGRLRRAPGARTRTTTPRRLTPPLAHDALGRPLAAVVHLDVAAARGARPPLHAVPAAARLAIERDRLQAEARAAAPWSSSSASATSWRPSSIPRARVLLRARRSRAACSAVQQGTRDRHRDLRR